MLIRVKLAICVDITVFESVSFKMFETVRFVLFSSSSVGIELTCCYGWLEQISSFSYFCKFVYFSFREKKER